MLAGRWERCLQANGDYFLHSNNNGDKYFFNTWLIVYACLNVYKCLIIKISILRQKF